MKLRNYNIKATLKGTKCHSQDGTMPPMHSESAQVSRFFFLWLLFSFGRKRTNRIEEEICSYTERRSNLFFVVFRYYHRLHFGTFVTTNLMLTKCHDTFIASKKSCIGTKGRQRRTTTKYEIIIFYYFVRCERKSIHTHARCATYVWCDVMCSVHDRHTYAGVCAVLISC